MTRRAAHAALRARARGVTLLEVMIVMILMVLVIASILGGSGQLAESRLKRSAAMITGAVRVAYTRATAVSKPQRIVFDLDHQQISLEESDAPMLVQSKDTTGTGGADPATALEQKALIDTEPLLKGPRAPRPHFHPVTSLGFTDAAGKKGPRSLERGITLREVQSMHDDSPRSSGRAYLYFWPGGQTERSSIQLRIGASTQDRDTITLLISPLTGKVTAKPGPVSLVIPTDDKEASDREDKGSF